MGTLDEYLDSLERSRALFRDQYGAVSASFQLLDTDFANLGNTLKVGQDENGNTHFGLASLLLILQRQTFVALDALSSMQSCQAWVLLRPGLEIALFMGKWMDEVTNYDIWTRRLIDPDAYRRTYSGKSLRSESLPRFAELQGSLKAINDSFAQPTKITICVMHSSLRLKRETLSWSSSSLTMIRSTGRAFSQFFTY